MQKPACWSRLGRGAVLTAAAAMLPLIGGCSSGVSRFDFPAFNMTSSNPPASASRLAYSDPDTTASLPVPPEPIYNSDGHYGSSGSYTGSTSPGVTRTSLPAVGSSYSTPRPMPASYSPAPLPHSAPNAYSPLPPVQPAHPQKAAYSNEPPVRPEPAVSHTPIDTPATHKVKVEKGDTLASIGRRYGVSAEQIQSANHLLDTHLSLGQELIMPGKETRSSHSTSEASAAPRTYKVQKGDTPHVIAQKLRVDEKELVAKNNLQANHLRIGQELDIPASGKHEPEETAPAVAEEPKHDEPAQAAADTPDVHKVHTTTIAAPGASGPGQPDTKQSAPASAPGKDKQNPSSQQSVAAAQDVTGEGEDKDSGGENPHVASNDQLPNPDPMSGNSFRWPVQGRIISEFGTKPDGGHNDGIDVAVPQGTPVKAAENGVVAYAGDELKGYGNLVLIRHANNWVSAYAHNDELLVKRGDKVRRGQIIAKAGKTGTVSQPLVHFELRKGSRPVDPTKYMGSAAASAD